MNWETRNERTGMFVLYHLPLLKHYSELKCNKNMYVEKSIGSGSKLFRVLFRFMFERKIKMDVLIFVIFALATNYCFIDGCRSKETTAEINLNNGASLSQESKSQERNSKELNGDFENSPASIISGYQVPMIYPYSYPVPGVFLPPSNAGNIGYYPESDLLPPQYIHSVQPPQIPSVPPQTMISQPTPAIPLSTIAQPSIDRPTPLPNNNQQNLPPVPIDLQPDFSVVQNDPQNYQQGFGGPSFQYNPCQNKVCRPGAKCVVRRNPTCPRCSPLSLCVDPCETVRCASGHVCKAEVGPCGTSFCEPRAVCKDLCQGVVCPGNETCTLVSLSGPSYDLVPICGRDPCETTGCPLGQGCYLQEQFCLKPPCTVEPVCRDPCKDVKCLPGEFCYTEDVQCIKAPCNPIPYCKNPCASVLCPAGQQCVLEQAFCIRTPCNPIAVCKKPY